MLSEKLYNLESFQRQYAALLRLSAARTVNSLTWEEPVECLLGSIDWNNMLGIASALSASKRNDHLDAALRIAQTTLMEENTTNVHKDAAAVVLLNLTNRPAVLLGTERGYLVPELQDRLPFTLKLQSQKSTFGSSIVLNDKVIQLNQFQRDVYSCYERCEAISISAPTSAGKSFVLYNILLDQLSQGIKNVAYIVPTRALISQVENDLRKLTVENGIPDTNISTVPQQYVDTEDSNIFVFTQERLHWFLAEKADFQVDILVIDEAQKIEDGHRGILLQQKLEQVLKTSSRAKVFFSSPSTSNPELLLEGIPERDCREAVNTHFVAVNQNLIYATQVPRKSREWRLSLCVPDNAITLGTIELADRPTTELKKVAFIAQTMTQGQAGSIIYANGAAEAEKMALLLYQLAPEEEPSDELRELAELVRKTVHNEYRLAEVLERGISFHYGNMPLLLREEIERLFKLGEIRFLVCTSTLLEGVNLPAKSVFVRKPTRGRGNPLSENDFWNLAGRAGRWGKEFSGNIVCIDPQGWPIPPNPIKSKQRIERAIDKICDEDLLDFIKNGSDREQAQKNPDLEFAFGYYYCQYMDGDLSRGDNIQDELYDLFDDISDRLCVPESIIKRNPGISPIAQQELLEYFSANLHRIEEMIPVYPEDSSADSEYAALVGRIGKTIAFYNPKLNYARSILLINWMSGKPLSQIIRSTYDYHQSKGRENKTIHVVIREVMRDVENFVRFRFAKDSSCYIDILRHFLRENRKEDLLEGIPELNLWLEFGVAQQTHLSLLSLGLRRNTAIELVEKYLTSTEMSVEEARSWLQEQDPELLDVPLAMKENIRAVLADNANEQHR